MLRLPEGMRNQIKESAERHNRSMNAEIISRLASTFGWDDLDEVPGYDRINPSADDIIDSLEKAVKFITLAKQRGEIE